MEETEETIELPEIYLPNVITFNEWQTLKQYGNITKGTVGFIPEELDEAVVFFDEKFQFLDYLERKKVENLTPTFVMLPRFFWQDRAEFIPEEFLPGLRIQERIQLLNTSREYFAGLQNRALAEVDLIKCTLTPRKEQIPVIDFFREEMQDRHVVRGILQAAPGAGKTAMAIMIANMYRSKMMVIVPNQILLDQWVDAILDATDLTLDDIGIIQGSNLDKIDCDVFDLEQTDKAIYIVKIQSLYSQIKHNHIAKIQQLYRYVDLVVYDECHNTGSATSYAKTSSLFLTPNILGLSATPYRKGLNSFLLRVSIGDTIYKLDHNNLSPDIEIHNVFTEFSPQENTRLVGAKNDYIIFLGIFNSLMKNKDTYFEYLADHVAWNLSQGYNIVALFPTIFMQEKLLEKMQERHPTLVDKILLLKGKTKQDAIDLVKVERKILMNELKEFKAELDIRVKTKEIKRKEANELSKEKRKEIDQKIEFLKEHSVDLYKTKIVKAEAIFSNYNLLSAGFDKANLSNLIIGGAPRIGKISVIQTIGRITRKYADKKHPLVQYFVPSKFFDFQKSTSVILKRNAMVQYNDAKFKYIGFDERKQ